MADEQNTPETTEEKKEEQKDAPAEAASEEKKEVEVPEKFKSLVETIEQMSVLDLSEFVGILEDKFGVSAAAPAMMMPGGAAAGGEAAEEKSEFDVELTGAGDNKIAVIKAVRAITGLGLKEAKGIVDDAPKVIKEGVPKEEAEDLKKQIEEAGGGVVLK